MTQTLRARDGVLIGLGAHSDDLAFSLGAALCDGRLAGCRPVTVFSRSGYTLAEPEGDAERVSALRKEEDLLFFSITPTRDPLWLDQSDAPLRRELVSETVFSAPVHPEELAEVSESLNAALPPTGTLLTPLSLGGHVDHRLVCQSACEFQREGRFDLVFYEDLPYAAFMAMSEIAVAVRAVERQLGVRLRPRRWPSPALVNAKQWAVQCYASQTGEGSLRALLHHAQRVERAAMPAERVWIPCR